MTNRIRQYHLGCGESLNTHYSSLWNDYRTGQKNTNKPEKQSVNRKLKQERAKD